MKKFIATAVVAASLAFIPAPSQAASCDRVRDWTSWSGVVFLSTDKKTNESAVGRVQYVRYAYLCGKKLTITGENVNYKIIYGKQYLNCNDLESVNVNPGPVAGFNPPVQKLPCSKRGAHKYVNIPDKTLAPGVGDRCAGADVVVKRKRTTDKSSLLLTCHSYQGSKKAE